MANNLTATVRNMIEEIKNLVGEVWYNRTIQPGLERDHYSEKSVYDSLMEVRRQAHCRD